MAMMGGIMSMAGGMVGAQGAMQEAEAKAKAAEYNAQVADRNRKIIKDQTQAAMADKRSENRRIIHSFRASYGASGIDMSGSAVDVIHDTAIEQFLDLRRIKYIGKIKMIEQKDTANLARMEATADMQAGRISALSSVLNGAAGMFSSFGSMIQ
jgi:hypothetical protein